MEKYEQIRVLGEGGYGKAILVRRKADDKLFVVKVMHVEAMSPKEREETSQEAQVLSSLHHPFIISFEESFHVGGYFYIVMEYADGGDLAQKIRSRGNKLFTEEEILNDFMQLALAIKYIHDRKILHRDLKAQNVFLMKDGTIKLGDFGIARVLEHSFQVCRTQIGSPFYLSPEICEGKAYNSKTDIWSLGCILYELCTLKHAFNAVNMNALLMNIIRGNYSPIPSTYSRELKQLVARMLTKDCRDRPSIKAVLATPIMRTRLSNFLDESQLVVTTTRARKEVHQRPQTGKRMDVRISPQHQRVIEDERKRRMVEQQRCQDEIMAAIVRKRDDRSKKVAFQPEPDVDTPPMIIVTNQDPISQMTDTFVREQQQNRPAWVNMGKQRDGKFRPRTSVRRAPLKVQFGGSPPNPKANIGCQRSYDAGVAIREKPQLKSPILPRDKFSFDSSEEWHKQFNRRKRETEINSKKVEKKVRNLNAQPVFKFHDDDTRRKLELQRSKLENKRLRMHALELGILSPISSSRDAMISEIEAELNQDPTLLAAEQSVQSRIEAADKLIGLPIHNRVVRKYNRNIGTPTESVSAARNHLMNIQSLADSIREALAFVPSDEEETFEQPNHQLLFKNKELNFPVVKDDDSISYRAEAIRAFLERELGLTKLLSLRQELLDQERNPFALASCGIEPSLIILTQQLLILDEMLV